jgi:RimJ/RimL family protein N-acetyltransferase
MKLIARTVSLDDADLILEWRNSIDARMMSRNSDPISVIEHYDWLNKWLGGENRGYFWIYSQGGKNIGYVRLDSTESKQQFEISIFIEANSRGQGMGKMLLEDSIARLFAIEKNVFVKATVLNSNLASMKLFHSFGFRFAESVGLWNYFILDRS